MTTENDRFDGESSVDDETLSLTYRQAASEATPRQLDARVLAAARRAASPRYLLPASWFRPLAWTATVGLCLAFAINLANLPEAPSAPPVELERNAVAGDEPAAAEERFEAQAKALSEQKRLRQQPAASIAAPAPRDGAAEADAAQSAAAERADMREAEPDRAGLEASASLDEAAPSAAAAHALRDADALADSGPESAAALCSAENLAAPEAWLRCIEALESEGRTEAAARERRRFELKFPDYDVD